MEIAQLICSEWVTLLWLWHNGVATENHVYETTSIFIHSFSSWSSLCTFGGLENPPFRISGAGDLKAGAAVVGLRPWAIRHAELPRSLIWKPLYDYGYKAEVTIGRLKRGVVLHLPRGAEPQTEVHLQGLWREVQPMQWPGFSFYRRTC